jgi:hypothetical protein
MYQAKISFGPSIFLGAKYLVTKKTNVIHTKVLWDKIAPKSPDLRICYLKLPYFDK